MGKLCFCMENVWRNGKCMENKHTHTLLGYTSTRSTNQQYHIIKISSSVVVSVIALDESDLDHGLFVASASSFKIV